MSEQKGNPLIRVLVLEDARLLREGIVALLSQPTDIEVVAELDSDDQFVRIVTTMRPDIALIDAEMPGGTTALEQLRSLLPGCRAVALLGRGDAGAHPAAAHAHGVLLKNTSEEFMMTTIRRVADGERVVDPTIARNWPELASNPLTPREGDVLHEAAAGVSTAEIALRLGLSPGTVRNYISRAISKTGARDRHHAVRIADQKGWLPPPGPPAR